jgi:hypothetical protein
MSKIVKAGQDNEQKSETIDTLTADLAQAKASIEEL